MNFSVQQFLQDHFRQRLQENVRLARYTTARVGGPARWFAESASSDQLAADVRFLWQNTLPFRILGNGSNLLMSDNGWNGMVLLNQAKAVKVTSTATETSVEAESGATLSSIVRLTMEQGLSGFEWAAGIPGTLGGAVYGNAGAHGQEISQNLILAEILHRE